MNVLHLPIKKKWFDMILSGEKKEEYREIKPHWTKRLLDFNGIKFKHFDIARIVNGYGANSPTFDIEIKTICKNTGKPELGAEPNKYYYVITMGKIIDKGE